MQVRQYQHVLAYLDSAEADYTDMLVTTPDVDTMRAMQGAISVLRELKKHITHNER